MGRHHDLWRWDVYHCAEHCAEVAQAWRPPRHHSWWRRTWHQHPSAPYSPRDRARLSSLNCAARLSCPPACSLAVASAPLAGRHHPSPRRRLRSLVPVRTPSCLAPATSPQPASSFSRLYLCTVFRPRRHHLGHSGTSFAVPHLASRGTSSAPPLRAVLSSPLRATRGLAGSPSRDLGGKQLHKNSCCFPCLGLQLYEIVPESEEGAWCPEAETRSPFSGNHFSKKNSSTVL